MSGEPSYTRQAACLAITQELALEGYMSFIRTHEGKAGQYPDYVRERLAALSTLQLLAEIEKHTGSVRLRAHLFALLDKARPKEADDAATA